MTLVTLQLGRDRPGGMGDTLVQNTYRSPPGRCRKATLKGTETSKISVEHGVTPTTCECYLRFVVILSVKQVTNIRVQIRQRTCAGTGILRWDWSNDILHRLAQGG